MKRTRTSNANVLAQKLAIAGKVVSLLRRGLGHKFIAAGVCGSVARGTADTYSDVDLIIVVKRLPRGLPRHRILDATYCSVNYVTWKDVVSQLTQPSDELPQIIGGFSKILPIHDPTGILKKIERRAASVRPELFRKSAELALLHSYEDFARIKNALLRRDHIVMRDNVYIVTDSAANIVASLNHAAFVSDREIFKAHKRFRKLPQKFDRIEELRYGNLRGKALYRTMLEFYIELIKFCRREGVEFPLNEQTLRELRQ